MRKFRIVIISLIVLLSGCSINNPLAREMKQRKCECNFIYTSECQILLSLNLSNGSYLFDHGQETDILEVGKFSILGDTLRLYPVKFMKNMPGQERICIVNKSDVNELTENKYFFIHKKKLIQLSSEPGNDGVYKRTNTVLYLIEV